MFPLATFWAARAQSEAGGPRDRAGTPRARGVPVAICGRDSEGPGCCGGAAGLAQWTKAQVASLRPGIPTEIQRGEALVCVPAMSPRALVCPAPHQVA